ncbi:MAG: hypothetical protein NTW21_00720 [Verrucomicrobia bacterium]|nr:hypothetical protein [Verrucomicrobiota bacterium]
MNQLRVRPHRRTLPHGISTPFLPVSEPLFSPTCTSTRKSNFLAILALVLAQPAAYAANGTAYYFDVDGAATAGFDTPSGDYNATGAYWSTSAAGTGATAALPGSTQLTFGSGSIDFAGPVTTTVNMPAGGYGFWGVYIYSTQANVTLKSTSNTFLADSQTWTVASGSTLTEDLTTDGLGLNMNGRALTLAGGGTINFNDRVSERQSVREIVTIHYPLSTIHYPLSTIHYPLSTIAAWLGRLFSVWEPWLRRPAAGRGRRVSRRGLPSPGAAT